MKILKLLGSLALPVLLAACAVGQTHEFSSARPVIQTKGDDEVAVATLDSRPYVLSGDKSVTFVGLQRGGFGNPFEVHTSSGQPMASDLTASIEAALKQNGFEVRKVDTEPGQSVEDLIDIMTGTSTAILVVVSELKSDTYNNTAFLYDLTLKVFDRNGMLIAESQVDGRDDLGGSLNPVSHAKSVVPAALQKKLELLLNHRNVAEALR